MANDKRADIIVVIDGYAVIDESTSKVLYRTSLRLNAESWCDDNGWKLPEFYGD